MNKAEYAAERLKLVRAKIGADGDTSPAIPPAQARAAYLSAREVLRQIVARVDKPYVSAAAKGVGDLAREWLEKEGVG